MRIIVNSPDVLRPGTVALVLVVSRFRVPVDEGESFRSDLQAALDALAERPGHLGGTIGRNLDEPEL